MPDLDLASIYIHLMKNLILVLALCLLVGKLLAQSNMDISWQACYGGGSNENRANILKTDFGYYLLSNTNSTNGQITNYWGAGDIWLTAIDNTGDFLWGRCYGGTNIDYAANIIGDGKGNYYIGGTTFSNDGDIQSGNHGNYDRWIVKTDAMGDILWERCYGGSGREYAAQLSCLSNGNIMVISATTSNDGDVPVNYGSLDAWITIINPENGDILKNKVFGNPEHNNIFDIVETRDGGFFFTSKAINATGMVQGTPHGGEDVWAIKTDSNLNIEWQKLYGGSKYDYQGWGLLELEDGYIFLANTGSDDGDVSGFHGVLGDWGTDDIWVVRINSIGDIIWQKCLGGSELDFGWEIIQSDDGGFVVFAETNSDDGDVLGLHANYNFQNDDIWMVKITANGDIEWSRCYGSLNSENLSFDAIVRKAEDNYIIAGSSPGSPSGYTEGDVNCSIHGSRDLWLFEIKDCSNYMPSIPIKPTGPDTLCTITDSTSIYSIETAQGAWYYEWQIVPTEAGTFLYDSSQTTATLHWSSNWEGQAQISVRSWNDCGQSAWSEIKNTWAYSCLGIESPSLAPRTPYLCIFPNPTKEDITIRYRIPGPGYRVLIYDLFGRKQDEIIVPRGQEQIGVDVSSYPAGVYVAVMKSGDGVVGRGKFVKSGNR